VAPQSVPPELSPQPDMIQVGRMLVLDGTVLAIDWLATNVDVDGRGFISSAESCDETRVNDGIASHRYLMRNKFAVTFTGTGIGSSGRVFGPEMCSNGRAKI
jgi:hypothetical protein